MVSLFQIYQRNGEDGFRAEHLIRYPDEEDYRPHCEVYRSDIAEARKWINEQMKDENLQDTYERIQLANNIQEKTDQTIYTMNEEVWRSIEKVRWLQTRELANKYPNDTELGKAVRDLIRKTPETI